MFRESISFRSLLLAPVLFLLISNFPAIAEVKKAKPSTYEQAQKLAKLSQGAINKHDYGTALALALEAFPNLEKWVDPKTPDIKSAKLKSWPGRQEIHDALLKLREKFVLKGHRGAIVSIAISGNSKKLVTGARDGSVRVWNTQTGKLERTLFDEGCSERNFVYITPDGQRILTLGRAYTNQNLRLWNAVTGKLIHKIKYKKLSPYRADATSDSKYFVFVQRQRSQNMIVIMDANTGKIIRSIDAGRNLYTARLSPDTKHIHTYEAWGDFRHNVWALDTGELVKSIVSKKVVRLFNVHNNFIIGKKGAGVGLLDFTNGQTKIFPSPNKEYLRNAQITPDNNYLVTGSRDGTARVWNLKSGSNVRTMKHGAGVQQVYITKDSSRIITESKNHIMSIWDLKTGQLQQELRGHEGGISKSLLSPDNQFVVTGSYQSDCSWRDNTVRIWNLEPNKKIRNLLANKDGISTIRLLREAYARLPRCLTQSQRSEFKIGWKAPKWCKTKNLWPYQTRCR